MQLPWHRNGCLIPDPWNNGTHWVSFGETGPLPGLGVAITNDFVNYTILNKTWMEPLGANNSREPEIVLEAATPPVKLSSGDYLHMYAGV
jgi:hypothetical protein